MAESREWRYAGLRGELVARTWTGHDERDHVVLVAHGYGEHVGRYERVADALVRNGGAVYAVDHAGHGRSEGERVLVEDFEDIVTDFHTLDETARREHPDLSVKPGQPQPDRRRVVLRTCRRRRTGTAPGAAAGPA